MTVTVRLPRPRNFALHAASEFFAGFTPGSGMAAAGQPGRGGLTLAFRLDRTFEAVAVSLRQEDQCIVLEHAGTSDGGAVRRQVARILGLDADADAWEAVGRAEPVVGRLQREFAGFFTAAKPSPYDAAIWAVISIRMPMTAAAALKTRIAREHGDTVALGDGRYPVFPAPGTLLRIGRIAGLADVKLARMKGIAEAALDGRLDAERLRAMPEQEALAALQRLPGLGHR